MFSKKNLSILIAAVLFCACIVGALLLGTDASAVEWDIGAAADYDSIESALAEAATMAENGEFDANSSLILTLKENVAATEANELLFGQTTIWRADGTKLPITIKGSSASIQLTLASGSSLNCANDYTFRDITLPWSENAAATYFYAGSGNVRFNNVSFGSGSNLYLRGDATSANVFTGWSAEHFTETNSENAPATTSSIIFGNGTTYFVHDRINSKGTNDSWSLKIDDTLTVKPANTKVKIVAESGSKIGRVRVCRVNTTANNKADEMILDVQSGAIVEGVLGVYGGVSAHGNMTIKFAGSTDNSGGRGYVSVLTNSGSTLTGNLKVEIDGMTTTPTSTYNFYLRMAGHNSGSAGNTITLNGNASLTIKNVDWSNTSYPVYGFCSGTTCTGTVTTNIVSGTISTYAPGTAGALNNVENYISGGTVKGALYGGDSNGGTVSGTIQNYISGGTFNGNVYGGSYSGTTGSIQNNISGGTFNNVSYIGPRLGTVNGNLENNISGGTFNTTAVHLGGNGATITGTVSSTVTGGKFESVCTLNAGALNNSAVTNKATLTIQPSGSNLEIYGTVNNCTNFVGNNGTVKIGKNTSVTAATASGKVTFLQTEVWLNGTYFEAAAGSITITPAQADGVIGQGKQEGLKLVGITEALYGVSFVFSDYVQLRFAFYQDVIQNASGDYTFTATIGDRQVASATFSEIAKNVSSDGYCTLLTEKLKASELAHSITYEGSMTAQNSISLLDLADLGVAAFENNEELSSLFKSFSNYAIAVRNYQAKAAGNEVWDLRYNAGTETFDTASFKPARLMSSTSSTSLTVAGRTLVLTEGIVIRYYASGLTSSQLDALTFYVNNEETVATATYNSANSTYPITIDIPVSVSESETRIRLTVKDSDGKVAFDFVDRLDCLAYLLKSEDDQLGNETLYYLRSAVAYNEASKAQQSASYSADAFSAGYGIEDVSPYGVKCTINEDNIGVEVIEPLYVTCVALVDENQNTVLYFSIPARKIPDNFMNTAKEKLSSFLGDKVDPDQIFFNATHSHSAPNITATSGEGIQAWYNEYLYPGVIRSAQEALMDLTEVSSAVTGTANSLPGTGYVRRYYDEDGTFTSGNYTETAIDANKGTANTYESIADKEMRVIQFARSGKDPILLVNWQGHAAHAVSVYTGDADVVDDAGLAADFVYYLQAGLAEKGYLCAFFNGGTGDINFANYLSSCDGDGNGTIDSTDRTNLLTKYGVGSTAAEKETYIHVAVGKSLVDTALASIKAEYNGGHTNLTYQTISTGTIRVDTWQQTLDVRKDSPERVDSARLLRTGIAKEEQARYYAMYGFHTSLDVTHTLKRNDTLGDTDELPISIVTFGDVSMAFTSYEMFHESASTIRTAALADGYKVAFVSGYTNGDDGYMPTELGFKNLGYEQYACFYDVNDDGVYPAEVCVNAIIAKLDEIKAAN